MSTHKLLMKESEKYLAVFFTWGKDNKCHLFVDNFNSFNFTLMKKMMKKYEQF